MIKKCKFCGKAFETDKSRRVYCSTECKNQSNRLYYRDYYKKHKKPKIVTCPICGKKFQWEISGRRKYCSEECSTIAKHQNNRDWYYKHREFSRFYHINRRKGIKVNLEDFYPSYKMDDFISDEEKECCKQHNGIENCPYPECRYD